MVINVRDCVVKLWSSLPRGPRLCFTFGVDKSECENANEDADWDGDDENAIAAAADDDDDDDGDDDDDDVDGGDDDLMMITMMMMMVR